MEKSFLKIKNNAFSLIEIMVSLIVLTVVMAAFAPVIVKRSSQKVQTGYIKQDDACKYISNSCYLCDLKKNICLGCELSCIDGKRLNYNKCKCE